MSCAKNVLKVENMKVIGLRKMQIGTAAGAWKFSIDMSGREPNFLKRQALSNCMINSTADLIVFGC